MVSTSFKIISSHTAATGSRAAFLQEGNNRSLQLRDARFLDRQMAAILKHHQVFRPLDAIEGWHSRQWPCAAYEGRSEVIMTVFSKAASAADAAKRRRFVITFFRRQ